MWTLDRWPPADVAKTLAKLSASGRAQVQEPVVGLLAKTLVGSRLARNGTQFRAVPGQDQLSGCLAALDTKTRQVAPNGATPST